MIAAGLLVLIVFVIALAFVAYIIREATFLKTTAIALQTELTQFKQGGFKTLIQSELTALTQRAGDELHSRELLILKEHAHLVDQQKLATSAAEGFDFKLRSLTTQVNSLQQLQTQVGELNNLLKPQQLRGELGEVIVRTLIADKLPQTQYEEEHAFADGKKVEFAIRLNGKLIPIDSKLQLEDFRRMREAEGVQRQTHRTQFKRSIRQKIDEVKQYIKPEEGTYNFALMVIPSEAVFYDLIAERDFTAPDGLYDYARSQNVFLTSPLTFWAYLTAIAQGLQGLEIGRRAEEILGSLQALSSEIRTFSRTEFRLVGEHLRNVEKNYDEAKEKLGRIEENLSSLERLEAKPLMREGVTV